MISSRTSAGAPEPRDTLCHPAQILLASDPLWATLFARALGGGEGDLGPSGWAGGALIVAGAVVAGVAGSRDAAAVSAAAAAKEAEDQD